MDSDFCQGGWGLAVGASLAYLGVPAPQRGCGYLARGLSLDSKRRCSKALVFHLLP